MTAADPAGGHPAYGDGSGLSDPISVVRSEEQVRTRLVRVPVERVRLEKYVVTEERTITVHLQREEVRLVREPMPAGHDASGSLPPDAFPGADPTFVLHEEQVSITKIVVPVERVTLVRDRITEDREVTVDVKKEEVEIDSLAPGI